MSVTEHAELTLIGYRRTPSQQTRYSHPLLDQCWSIVYDAGSLEVLDRVSETQLQVGEISN